MNLTFWNSWLGLGAVLAVYVAVALALRLRRRSTLTTVYEPPDGMSPALAAYIMEDGNAERAFAAALVSLAGRGLVGIRQVGDCFELRTKKGTAAANLPVEEQALLGICRSYPDGRCSFTTADYPHVGDMYVEFRKTLVPIAEPDYISDHLWILGSGVAAMVAGLVGLYLNLPHNSLPSQSGSLYLLIWIVLGGFAAIAAVHTWWFVLKKVAARLRFTNPAKRKFTWNDLLIIPLTCAVGFGFAFLTYLASAPFAELCGAALFIAFIGRSILTTPTSKGFEAIAYLKGYREFLCRTESDHLKRENRPDETPDTIEPFGGYAVALKIDQGWGEEFAEILSNMLEIDQAYSFRYWDWSRFLPKKASTSLSAEDSIALDSDPDPDSELTLITKPRRKRTSGATE